MPTRGRSNLSTFEPSAAPTHTPTAHNHEMSSTAATEELLIDLVEPDDSNIEFYDDTELEATKALAVIALVVVVITIIVVCMWIAVLLAAGAYDVIDHWRLLVILGSGCLCALVSCALEVDYAFNIEWKPRYELNWAMLFYGAEKFTMNVFFIERLHCEDPINGWLRCGLMIVAATALFTTTLATVGALSNDDPHTVNTMAYAIGTACELTTLICYQQWVGERVRKPHRGPRIDMSRQKRLSKITRAILLALIGWVVTWSVIFHNIMTDDTLLSAGLRCCDGAVMMVCMALSFDLAQPLYSCICGKCARALTGCCRCLALQCPVSKAFKHARRDDRDAYNLMDDNGL